MYLYRINLRLTKTMVYKFRIISDEVDDFLREIKIDSDASFYDLHEAILKCTNYKNDQMDTFVMKDTRLSELLEDEKQKLIYVFDPLTERVFFIELAEIITGKDLQHAVCSRKEGNPPQQTVDFDEQMKKMDASLDLDENFYGDQEYDVDDFDPDGYDIGSGGNPYDEDKY